MNEIVIMLKLEFTAWSGITLTNSEIPQPQRMTKHKILNGLLDIYDDWKKQLDQLGQPYYMKIWLLEPRFSQSQVVCAIGDSIDYYKNIFFEPETGKNLNFAYYGQIKNRLHNYNWDCRLDEDHYSSNEVGDPELYATRQEYEETKIWFEKLLKKKHRTHNSNAVELYSYKRGYVWVGGQ
ncbi:MAG: hypothetical protein LBH14_05165 [Desulfobulbaceae bacterium]|jgi:hypothetical protein|nr:hypothetical protein [Desulfobulbaceae bacterium]